MKNKAGRERDMRGVIPVDFPFCPAKNERRKSDEEQ